MRTSYGLLPLPPCCVYFAVDLLVKYFIRNAVLVPCLMIPCYLLMTTTGNSFFFFSLEYLVMNDIQRRGKLRGFTTLLFPEWIIIQLNLVISLMRMAHIIKSSSSSSYCVLFCCLVFWFFINDCLTWAIEDVPTDRFFSLSLLSCETYFPTISRNATDFYSLFSYKTAFQWPIQHFSWRKFVYIRRIRNRPSTHVKRFIFHKSLLLDNGDSPFEAWGFPFAMISTNGSQSMIVISGYRPSTVRTHIANSCFDCSPDDCCLICAFAKKKVKSFCKKGYIGYIGGQRFRTHGGGNRQRAVSALTRRLRRYS